MTASPPWRVAVMGECMVELHKHRDNIRQTFGGDTLNTAAYLARLQPGAHVEYVSALGTDSFSEAMLAFWQQCGVHAGLTQRLPAKLPGLYAIEVDSSGERHFLYWRNEAAVRGCFETPEAPTVLRALEDFDQLYLSGISLAVLYPQSREALLSRLEELAARGKAVAFDFNFRPRLWGETPEAAARPFYERIARVCRTVFLSLEEAAILGAPATAYTPDLVARLQGLGAAEVVVKDSGRPCLVVERESGVVQEVALGSQVSPLDTTAAGDAFAAAYLASRHQGDSAADAVRRAHRLSSTVIMHPGAIIPQSAMPDIFAD